MADLTLAEATAKGWTVELGPTAASAAGGPTRLVKHFVLSGATISNGYGASSVQGYHIGTGASGDRSPRRVTEYAATQAQALSQITAWENRMAAIRDGIGYSEPDANLGNND